MSNVWRVHQVVHIYRIIQPLISSNSWLCSHWDTIQVTFCGRSAKQVTRGVAPRTPYLWLVHHFLHCLPSWYLGWNLLWSPPQCRWYHSKPLCLRDSTQFRASLYLQTCSRSNCGCWRLRLPFHTELHPCWILCLWMVRWKSPCCHHSCFHFSQAPSSATSCLPTHLHLPNPAHCPSKYPLILNFLVESLPSS